jgi:hypothetical protein
MRNSTKMFSTALAAIMLISAVSVSTPASAWGRYGWGGGWGRHAGWGGGWGRHWGYGGGWGRGGWGYGGAGLGLGLGAGLLGGLALGAGAPYGGYGYYGSAYPGYYGSAACGTYGAAYPAPTYSYPATYGYGGCNCSC